ncbi:hypothetical protein WJX84_011182 [Apatococcus fuscideae]|uniref:Uncharacterized protein n=1 Tax=Apatococcus fuscideae TaxID=2026836 RepID=A0AAW1T996_9CHLO
MDLLYLLLITSPKAKGRCSWALVWWRVKHALWRVLAWLLQDFEPWLKWLLFDALKNALVNALARAFPALQPVFAFLGLG